jgi:predicted Holliday junction resolvase-like endonuclease
MDSAFKAIGFSFGILFLIFFILYKMNNKEAKYRVIRVESGKWKAQKSVIYLDWQDIRNGRWTAPEFDTKLEAIKLAKREKERDDKLAQSNEVVYSEEIR